MAINPGVILSDELDDQLNETRRQLESAQSSKKTTETELQRLESLKNSYQGTLSSLQNNYQLTRSQIDLIQNSISDKEGELSDVEKQIDETQKDLEKRTEYLKASARSLYISDNPTTLVSVFTAEDANLLTHILFYQNVVLNNVQEKIKDLNQQVHKISEIKKLLEEIKAKLAADKEALIARQNQLQGQIGNTQNLLSNAVNQQSGLQQSLIGLDQQINSLTQKQKEILAAKAAAALASTSVGNSEINKAAIEKQPPKDGNVYFSFWTYGYPHRVGMSQYGAFGRAIAGQSVDQILRAYYSGVEIVDWSGPDQIQLTSGQSISFEDDYLLGIGEMPSCWGSPDRKGLEALKAQAIAARSYAISYTDNGVKPICTDQNCQVYVGASKVNGTCGEYWRQAVQETRGKVITAGGSPITAWYASTSGGFTLSSATVWGSARSYVQGISDFDTNGKPYEGPGYGESPWYHKSWGNEPWLSRDQVADLLNAALMPEKFNDVLAPENKGGLSPSDVVSSLSSEGITPITNLKALEVVDQNGNSGAGTAQNKWVRVYFEDNQMTEIEASRFKFVFNLRSPGTNAIWTTRFDIQTAAEL